MEDVIIIGAGPCGISAAIECQKQGLSALIIEKHFVVHSIYLYPTHMQFFSTAEMLEIGNIPFATPNDKPFRHEALTYYRRVIDHYKLRIQSYEEATTIERQQDGTFEVHTTKSTGTNHVYKAKNVIISTGYFDHPNLLGIPGEDMDKVTHYFREAHPYSGMKVAIIGGSNSAVDAAMELLRVGAKIDVIYRGEDLSGNIKPWVKPLFESMVNKGRITLHLSSQVTSIEQDVIHYRDRDGNIQTLENDFVLALTGFRPDRKLLTTAGVELDDNQDKPHYNPETMESNVPGLFVAGVIASGSNANEVFIETGRDHGKLIAQYIKAKG
ncbi:YpdA family putative bacillithiol disulfide reductase [Paenibacillus sediminis]|uniref:Thioredoxin reductase (NADPH) n=1 Tax=Paenibacillus sediminis TaxID=664909 RepID=A0ABS4H234_9BACL|nr:YpdA family putative bacillithiol disulfide reductase [Paenibacillus sediminis]MBP1936322.1 thioredoxin reductase (NADPH) [Paenibacillus sediminis]